MKNVVLLVALVLCSGCATLVGGGKTQELSFDSAPIGARVLVDGEEVGLTPASTSLQRKNKAVITLELAGYQTREITLDRGINGWFWGNLLLGGLIGMAVDASTGAMYTLSPEDVSAELERDGDGEVVLLDDGLYVFFTLTPLPTWSAAGGLEEE